MFLDNKLPRSDARHVNRKTDELVSRTLVHSHCGFDRSEKFRTFIYFNFGVLLQENWDVIPETEYGAPISIYHSLDNTKKRNFKTLFWMTYVCMVEAKPIKITAVKNYNVSK